MKNKNQKHVTQTTFCLNDISNVKVKTKKLKILENLLKKKVTLFDEKFDEYTKCIKEANGQPLNDKRNGQATLKKWDKKNIALLNLKESIKKTKEAIDMEIGKIIDVEHAKNSLPKEIIELVNQGVLKQWRKHPNILFVAGVQKARIYWRPEQKKVSYKYLRHIKEKEQWKKFAKIYNQLAKSLNN